MDKKRKQNWQIAEDDALDRALNAGLAKYAAAEPRTGLEERILANLQAERGQSDDRAWWWGAAALATVLLVIVGLAWTTMRRAPLIARRPAEVAPHVQLPAPQIASIRPPAPNLMATSVAHRSKPAARVNPKLDQFPSPQPLSEQEKILASYVDAYPEHAILLARARTEALRRDQIEEMRSYSQSDGASDLDDRSEDRNSNK
jgi:hypothetical protein